MSLLWFFEVSGVQSPVFLLSTLALICEFLMLLVVFLSIRLATNSTLKHPKRTPFGRGATF